MRFLIVEDHPIYAEALMGVIASAFPGVEVALSGSISAAQGIVRDDSRLDLVLLDLWLPDSNGFAGLITLRMMRPSLPIAVISAFMDAEVIHHAIACGAAGFITKTSSKHDLIAAIREVLAGNVPLPPHYRPPQSEDASDTEALRHKLGSLTPQQMRVLQMLCQGLLNKQIAHEMGIGETTVKAHVSEILRKFGVGSRTQAVLGVSKVWGAPGLNPKQPHDHIQSRATLRKILNS